jgi:hypothetical protein
MLINVYKNGGKIGAYKNAVKHLNIDINKSINGFNEDDKLPWDFLQNVPTKQQLLNELKRLEKFL